MGQNASKEAGVRSVNVCNALSEDLGWPSRPIERNRFAVVSRCRAFASDPPS